ncbi:helicase-exonuclease AddAB subunit AddA [Niallia endozanthoxylica]|uniref:ATP-dependent helicase/nuclease subunit A n=1 Tax=Niallia endozanthoxylica TaxID=2036016 RepID=A0A5J5HZ24_9BACI|nr:helicase-exonuclease AddAB subunit AddA [Niallia endozanthoxylica]KAA9027509.1 helicase-exonuclease AddAB subunit AddA [Niallia endozanthoxylica]
MGINKIPPKPEDATWTDDQWKAIMASGQDILVAAAAGSGKTAVLVERMIKKVLSKDTPINVDELLVVTFTNASAAEMRHRISEALEKAINEDPTSHHLRKQLSLLNRASISTIHSFCLEVIRKYYYMIDVDPGFRIADETEGQLLRDEVLDELFEEEYGKAGNEDFFRLVDSFTNDRSDTALMDIIRDLYDFARANPDPDRYLQKIVQMYDVDTNSSIDELPFMETCMFDVELQLEGVKGILEKGLALTKVPGGPAPREENFLDDLKIVEVMQAACKDSWNTLYQAMQNWSFSRAKTCRGDEFNKELIDRAQKLREAAKKKLQDLQKEFFSRKPESFLQDMKEMKPIIHTLTQLVQRFSERFSAVKREKGLVDFADLEHYCLEILLDSSAKNDGVLIPSAAALHYRDTFKEVLVDEYQDVNLVQESIIQLVTKEEENTGNLFMVGDVKQSIYRFRLAEPNLFLGKYNRFTDDGNNSGLKIDLARNFRSRHEVLSGTNYLFKQIMGVNVGEIEYNEAAELVKGASYPEDVSYPVEVMLIDLEKEESDSEGDSSEETEAVLDEAELAQSQLEARVMAKKIKEMIAEKASVYNPKTSSSRSVMYKDIVILLRSMTWAPQIIEECKQQGIPIYANLSTGYFQAVEITIMMSLLKVIDNPFQDIPLAAVLRSPIVGLHEEELAKVRIHEKNGTFYDALSSFCRYKQSGDNERIYDKVKPFLLMLDGWRSMARQGSLSSLIWQLYRDTHFYDFAGGLPGGKQRQANLRALYDRARQYEATSFRGLFRFLRFIERMQERGDDLGAARALGEQEDVVRIMTIHSSKGLEFPIVFVAGLGRQFNMMDLKKPYLLDKEFGFASKYVNVDKRITYPSLPQLAFKRKKKLETLAEEMRVLYVALTRAKERLFLISSVKSLQKKLSKWEQTLNHPDWLLQDYERASADSYLDWVGPSLIRHRDCHLPLEEESKVSGLIPQELIEHPSRWQISVINAEDAQVIDEEEQSESDSWLKTILQGETIQVESPYKNEIEERLSWQYPYRSASTHRSKQSVSEIKRQKDSSDETSGTELLRKFKKPLMNRPRFMQEKALSPAEIGTAMHMVMQHIDFSKSVNSEAIMELGDDMVRKELLTEEQKSVIDPDLISTFFESSLGKRMTSAPTIKREVPFSLALPAEEAYEDWNGKNEPVLVQGIIDCLFEDQDGLVLVDYKTDGITDRYKGGFEEARPILEKRYRIQIDLYTKAVEHIYKRPIKERYLFFFDGAHILKLE